MALVRCPECGKDISSFAQSCIHCGYPMDQPDDDTRYALVMMDGGTTPQQTIELLVQRKGLSPQEAAPLAESAPVILEHGLLFGEAREDHSSYQRVCTVKVVREENATSIERAVQAPEVDFQTPSLRPADSPVTFQTIVGGTITGLFLWSIIAFFLAMIFQG